MDTLNSRTHFIQVQVFSEPAPQLEGSHTGMIKGKPAKTHQADYVEDFYDADEKFCITQYEDNSAVILQTAKGRYDLPFNNAAGIYKGIANGIKVHVVLKKITGKLIYWACLSR